MKLYEVAYMFAFEKHSELPNVISNALERCLRFTAVNDKLQATPYT